MFHLRLADSLLLCFFSSFLMIAPLASAAEQNLPIFSVGDAKVVPLQDFPSEMKAEIFHGASQELIASLAPEGKSPSSITAFLIQLNGKNILIDTGLGSSTAPRMSRLSDALKKMAIKPSAIDAILITHFHGDHIGGLAKEGSAHFPKAVIYVSRPEYDFWLGDKNQAVPASRKPSVDLARKTLDLYKGRIKFVVPGEQVFSGITAKEAFGHTPGHTGFLLEAKGEKLFFWGDIVHAAALQFAHPEIFSNYDMNAEQTVATRIGVMTWAASEKIPVAGTHLPYPSIGRVEASAVGSFAYLPGMSAPKSSGK